MESNLQSNKDYKAIKPISVMIEEPDAKSVIDFTKHISERASNFTGREWIFKELNNWLANDEGSCYFLLTGKPGSGKTAIASRLCQFSMGEVCPSDEFVNLHKNFFSAIHFCNARDSRWINPLKFVESLALQLSKRFPAYGKALAEKSGDRQIRIDVAQHDISAEQVVGVRIENINISGVSPEDAFNRIVREPLEILFRQDPPKSVVILVDALDEALIYNGDVNIVSLLARAENMPKGVRFILTSRRDERVENEFLSAEGLFLSAREFDKNNEEDIGSYVKRRFQDIELSQKFAELKPEKNTELEKLLTNKAEGNFQYISFLLNSIANGSQKLNELESLPAGLDALYYESLARVIKLSKNWSKDFSSLMGVLSVAQESMNLTQLKAITGKEDTWTSLGHIQQFIETVESTENNNEDKYRLYHQSIIDFLHSPSLFFEKKRLRNTFYLSAEEFHRKIIDYYLKGAESWDSVIWGQVDNYGLLHITSHILFMEDDVYHKKLYNLINKTFMWEKHARFGSHHSFASDVKLAIKVARSEEPTNIVQEVRGILIFVLLGLRSTNIPPEVLGVLAYLKKDERALDIASLIQDKYKQAKAYCSIGEELLYQKEIKKAKIVFDEAWKLSKAIKNQDQSELLVRITKAMTQLGDKEKTIEIADDTSAALDGFGGRFGGLQERIEIVKILAQIGAFDEALEVAKDIDYFEIKIEIAKEMAKFKDKREEAIALSMEALASAIKVEKDSPGKEAVSMVANVIAQIVEFDQALAVADDIEIANIRDTILKEIAVSRAQSGDINQALTAVKKIKNLSTIANVMSEIAEVKSEDKKVITTEVADNMHEAAENIHDFHDFEKAEALIKIAKAINQLGDGDGAIKIIKVILEKAKKLDAYEVKLLRLIAETVYQLKDKEATRVAYDILAEVNDISEQNLFFWPWEMDDLVESMSIVAKTIAKFEDKKMLANEAEKIKNELFKALFRIVIVEIMDQSEDRDEAIKTIKEVQDVITKHISNSGINFGNFYFIYGNWIIRVLKVMARMEEYLKAYEITKLIKNSEIKAEGLFEIAKEMAQSENKREEATTVMKEALKNAKEELKKADKDNFDEAAKRVAKIIKKMAQTTEFNEVLAEAENIGYNEYLNYNLNVRVEVLKEIAKEKAQSKEIDQALIAAGKTNNLNSIAEVVNEIAKTIARSEDNKVVATEIADKVLKVTENIKYDHNADALIEIIKTIDQLGDRFGAIRIADKALADYEQGIILYTGAKALSRMANEMAKLGEKEKTSVIAIRGQKLAEEHLFREDIIGNDMLIEITEAWARIEEFEKAQVAADKIKDRHYKAEALSKIAKVMADQKKFNQALKIAKNIDLSHREKVLIHITKEMAQYGGKIEDKAKATNIINEAKAITEEIKDGYYKAEALSEVAKAIAQQKESDKALELAKNIQNEYGRVIAIVKIAEVMAQSEDKREEAIKRVEEAQTEAEKIKIGYRKAEALSKIAIVKAQLSYKEEANKLVENAHAEVKKIEYRGGRAKALSMIAKTMAKLENFDGALKAAKEAEDYDTLSEIAVSMAIAQPEKFDQAQAEILSIDDKKSRTDALDRVGKRIVDIRMPENIILKMRKDFSEVQNSGLEEVFNKLEEWTPLMAVLDNEQTLWKIYKAIVEVDEWWAAK